MDKQRIMPQARVVLSTNHLPRTLKTLHHARIPLATKSLMWQESGDAKSMA
ncbi:MAG: hypothetical protein ACPH5P_08250 [Akkermansiaceae bacterium]